MKSIFSVNKKWNQLMGIIGTPVAVFICLSWCDASIGITTISMLIFFAIGIMLTSPNFILGVIESIVGGFILIWARKIFLIPIPLFWSSEPFRWFDHQTACAGVATIIFVMGLFKLLFMATTNE